MKETYPTWNLEEIALTFIYWYPHLDLSTSQVKWHLKHLDAKKEHTTNRINIFSIKNETMVPNKNQNYSNAPLYVIMNTYKISMTIYFLVKKKK